MVDALFVIWLYRRCWEIEFLAVKRERGRGEGGGRKNWLTQLSEKGKLVIDRFVSTPRGRDLDTMSIATSVPMTTAIPIARKWNDVSKETSNSWIRTHWSEIETAATFFRLSKSISDLLSFSFRVISTFSLANTALFHDRTIYYNKHVYGHRRSSSLVLFLEISLCFCNITINLLLNQTYNLCPTIVLQWVLHSYFYTRGIIIFTMYIRKKI